MKMPTRIGESYDSQKDSFLDFNQIVLKHTDRIGKEIPESVRHPEGAINRLDVLSDYLKVRHLHNLVVQASSNSEYIQKSEEFEEQMKERVKGIIGGGTTREYFEFIELLMDWEKLETSQFAWLGLLADLERDRVMPDFPKSMKRVKWD